MRMIIWIDLLIQWPALSSLLPLCLGVVAAAVGGGAIAVALAVVIETAGMDSFRFVAAVAVYWSMPKVLLELVLSFRRTIDHLPDVVWPRQLFRDFVVTYYGP